MRFFVLLALLVASASAFPFFFQGGDDQPKDSYILTSMHNWYIAHLSTQSYFRNVTAERVSRDPHLRERVKERATVSSRDPHLRERVKERERVSSRDPHLKKTTARIPRVTAKLGRVSRDPHPRERVKERATVSSRDPHLRERISQSKFMFSVCLKINGFLLDWK